ncbi:hypothetical protein IG631_09015 [Alternaria alternata]|nr:hypothetical protein IG631_09015 [Alternaria alternata]
MGRKDSSAWRNVIHGTRYTDWPTLQRFSHISLFRTVIQKKTLGTQLFSDTARASIPELNDTNKSRTNFGGIPPLRQIDRIAYTPALQPISRRGPIIEGGSDEEVLVPIIQHAIDMPRKVPPPSTLPHKVFRPVKQPTTAIASLQESFQSSGGAATSQDTPSGRYTRLASTSSSGSPTSQPAQPPAALIPPSSPMQRNDGNFYDRNKTEGEKEKI